MPFLNNLSSTEIFIIIFVLFAIFGGKKVHQWSKDLGKTGKEVKKAKKEIEKGFEDNDDEMDYKKEGVV